MNELDKLIGIIPEKWRPWMLGLLIASPYITRAYHALASGGGLRGVASAIWMGTNTPKPKSEESKP